MENSIDSEKRRLLLPREEVCESLPDSFAEVTDHTNTKLTEEVKGSIAEDPLLEGLAQYIRDLTQNNKLARYSMFLEQPFEFSEEEVQEALKALQGLEAYDDIIELEGKKTHYFYSNKTMANNYAKMLVLLEERDTCNTIAELVRFECKVYPRPYAVEMLRHLPFCYTDSQIKIALDLMKKAQEYQDIQPLYASNGAVYLFSNNLMESSYAQSLCEWIEVEQFDNP